MKKIHLAQEYLKRASKLLKINESKVENILQSMKLYIMMLYKNKKDCKH